ncbi:MAG: DeoR/GlpR transcriptional regulator [Clostridia bacterium]|nr:DeoR/GlpR transcriptional regulator [Clostridia bacterium]
MFATERQDKILEILSEKGAVSITNLVKVFGVSAETIRRDLLTMEGQGRLSRVHGGAVAKRNMKPFYDLQERNKAYSRQKQDLAKLAAEFVTEGDIIAIDSGSTAIFFAEALRIRKIPLTVVTYSLDVFNILCQQKQISVILSGGHYMPAENSFYGQIALESLRALHVKKLFLCPSGLSYDEGIWDYQNELVQIQKQLLSAADEVYILADSSKFEKKALLKLADMSTKYRYITDGDLSEEMRELYLEKGYNISIGGSKK